MKISCGFNFMLLFLLRWYVIMGYRDKSRFPYSTS